ncbi:leucine-rich repeat-containing G-protein coupled receptor 6-like [Ostrinia nubilalis]|uniref:leucine-rich repeat-containing G-protein coupled receptor 6-like n=1 Tax=Ostrinia nubilalis TaxID=29057 RepID=UPI00308259E3
MAGRVTSCVLIFILGLSGVYSENETAPAASDSSIVMQTGICRRCICKDNKVDCSEQGLTKFFHKNEWEALQEFAPTTVDMSDNSFENITEIGNLTSIEVLNLTRCGIEFLDNASFRDLQRMRVLDLSHNKLTSRLSPHVFEGRYSPEKYEPLESMRVLSLAYNDIHSLHQDLFEHLPELTELDLSGNPLLTIDYPTLVAISSLPMLKVFRMRSCQLTEIPDKFLHTPRYLERLDLSDNLLKAVPQELEETKNLLYLNLNQNPIQELDMDSEEFPGFPRLRKLKELHMCNMHSLKRIGPEALSGLENLEKLHLSFNPQLSELSPRALARPDDIGETYDWPLISELYLQSNNLPEIDRLLISRWDLVKVVDVSDNPFMCDCSTQWMVDMLVPVVEKISPNSSSRMVCNEPIEMRGLTMQHLNSIHRHMRCVDKYGHRPEKDGAILLGTLIGVLLAVPVMLSLMLLWNRGYFACIGLRGPTSDSRAFYKRAPHDDNFM